MGRSPIPLWAGGGQNLRRIPPRRRRSGRGEAPRNGITQSPCGRQPPFTRGPGAADSPGFSQGAFRLAGLRRGAWGAAPYLMGGRRSESTGGFRPVAAVPGAVKLRGTESPSRPAGDSPLSQGGRGAAILSPGFSRSLPPCRAPSGGMGAAPYLYGRAAVRISGGFRLFARRPSAVKLRGTESPSRPAGDSPLSHGGRGAADSPGFLQGACRLPGSVGGHGAQPHTSMGGRRSESPEDSAPSPRFRAR
jgi:hypothetical protein